jgi:hypothetical protein
VAGFMPPQVITVSESFVAVATDKGCLGFRLLLDIGDRRTCAATTTSSTASTTGHIVF